MCKVSVYDRLGNGIISPRRARRLPGWALAALAAVALLASAGAAAGQGVPGGPDLPPPDIAPAPAPTPTPTPSPTPAPATPSTQNPPADTGPSPEELAAQREAELEKARQEALARAREQARQRREALERLRRERAAEFRDVTGFSQAQDSISVDLDAAIRTLDRVALDAAIAVPAESAASPEGEAGRGRALLIMLLGASALSAILVLAASLARRVAPPEEVSAQPGGRVQSYVAGRIPFVEGHRLELAGVSVGCLLFALLIFVGAI